jgi:hypothetical protein
MMQIMDLFVIQCASTKCNSCKAWQLPAISSKDLSVTFHSKKHLDILNCDMSAQLHINLYWLFPWLPTDRGASNQGMILLSELALYQKNLHNF